jgi:hypothetical protein
MEFEVDALPSPGEVFTSKFDISSEYPANTWVSDSNLNNIPVNVSDGTYTNQWFPIHDVAVSKVDTSKNTTFTGNIISISADAANNGNVPENFSVTAYANQSVIGTQETILPGNTLTTLYFSWDTTGLSTGAYVISGEADAVPGETNTTNNLFVYGTVQLVPPVHDVAISKVTATKNVPYGTISISVDVANLGDLGENVSVHVLANGSVIWTQAIMLSPHNSTTLYFSWDTTGLSTGAYVISGEADAVPGETNTTNNLFVYGTVQAGPRHNVAVTGIYPSEDIVWAGYATNVSVNVENEDNSSVNVGVTLYADSDTTRVCDEVVIGEMNVTVDQFSFSTVVFTWDTTGLKAGTYTFTAVTSPLPEETNLEDNNRTEGSITLEAPFHPHPADAMWVEQPTTVLTLDNGTLGSRFNITVWLNMTEDVYVYQVGLLFNCTLLKCTNAGFTAGVRSQYFAGHPTTTGMVIDTSYLGNGSVLATETCAAPDFISGPRSASLFWAEFEVLTVPSVKNVASELDISSDYAPGGSGDTFVARSSIQYWDFTPFDGYYAFARYPPAHDVAVENILPSENAVYINDSLSVDVGVWNKEDTVESVNVTLYADTNTTRVGDEIIIGSNVVTLGIYGTSTTTFGWDTTNATAGNYSLTAVVSPLPGEIDIDDNNMTYGFVQLFQALLPCPDINVICPANLTVNPSVFTFDPNLHARLINIGNVSVVSTGFEGGLRVVGSRNDTIQLCVEQPGLDFYAFYLAQNETVEVPLWLMFQPETHWETYQGTYTLSLIVCGTHRSQLTIREIDITVCQNGAYIVNNSTATFTWNLTGGSLVYLVAETNLPPGWTYSVDPPIGTFFETPHIVNVNITAPPDAAEGEIGQVTLRAYKNSTGTMIWQFIYFASTENKPPTVEKVETPTLSPDGYVLFNATVSDHSGIDNVFLHYAVNGGTWQNTTMQWSAGDTFNATQYTRKLFFGTTQQTIQYYVSAVDWLGNQTNTDTQTISIMNDVSFTGFSAVSTAVFEGSNVTLSGSIANQGTLPLSFVNVVLYANSTPVATQIIYNLQNGSSATISFSVLLPTGTYIMGIVATPLPDENNTDNNAGSTTVQVFQLGSGGGEGRMPCMD